jgi:hypothetical protein
VPSVPSTERPIVIATDLFATVTSPAKSRCMPQLDPTLSVRWWLGSKCRE